MGPDKEGVAFDPSLHFADKQGKGVLTKAGVWRKRPGIKTPKESVDVAALLARIAQLEAKAATPDPRLAEAEAELSRLKAPVRSVEPDGPAPRLVPYKGMVRALVNCTAGQPAQFYKEGEAFFVDLPALWTDDPYEPVMKVDEDAATGTPIFGKDPHAVQVDFRFRPRSHEAIALSDGPRRAAEY